MRKSLVSLGSLLIIVSLAVVVAPPIASAQPDAVGNGSCKFQAGTGSFSPALSPAGTASVTSVTIKFTVSTAKDCSSSLTTPTNGVIKGLTNIVGQGKYKASGFANKCTNFETIDLANIKVTTNWIAAPAIAATSTHYINQPGTVAAGPPVVITLNGPPATTVTGSFSTPANTGAKLVLTTTIPACPAHVSAFKITGSYTSFSN
jgi:hypothetical protein